eukprot:2011486-Rhodomonas_salina.2
MQWSKSSPESETATICPRPLSPNSRIMFLLLVREFSDAPEVTSLPDAKLRGRKEAAWLKGGHEN